MGPGDRPGVVGALTAGIQATLAQEWSTPRAKPATLSRRSSWTGGRYETTGLVGSVEFNALEAGSSFDLIIVQTAACLTLTRYPTLVSVAAHSLRARISASYTCP